MQQPKGSVLHQIHLQGDRERKKDRRDCGVMRKSIVPCKLIAAAAEGLASVRPTIHYFTSLREGLSTLCLCVCFKLANKRLQQKRTTMSAATPVNGRKTGRRTGTILYEAYNSKIETGQKEYYQRPASPLSHGQGRNAKIK